LPAPFSPVLRQTPNLVDQSQNPVIQSQNSVRQSPKPVNIVKNMNILQNIEENFLKSEENFTHIVVDLPLE
jgi:hypothetical protein